MVCCMVVLRWWCVGRSNILVANMQTTIKNGQLWNIFSDLDAPIRDQTVPVPVYRLYPNWYWSVSEWQSDVKKILISSCLSIIIWLYFLSWNRICANGLNPSFPKNPTVSLKCIISSNWGVFAALLSESIRWNVFLRPNSILDLSVARHSIDSSVICENAEISLSLNVWIMSPLFDRSTFMYANSKQTIFGWLYIFLYNLYLVMNNVNISSLVRSPNDQYVPSISLHCRTFDLSTDDVWRSMQIDEFSIILSTSILSGNPNTYLSRSK